MKKLILFLLLFAALGCSREPDLQPDLQVKGILVNMTDTLMFINNIYYKDLIYGEGAVLMDTAIRDAKYIYIRIYVKKPLK